MKTILFFLVSLYFNFSFAQEIQTKFISEISLQADDFVGVDDFQNLYYIENNILYKKTDKRAFSYSNVNLGKLTSVSIQNPFKLILFYKDFNSVIILDNNLNELSDKIDFTQETLFNNVLFVSSSSENNIWLYADDNKLHVYDYQKLSSQIQTQAITFYQIDFQPQSLKSTYKNVWVLSNSEVIQFNEYGNYIQSFDLENIDHIFPFRKGFIYVQGKFLFYRTDDQSTSISLDYDHSIKDMYINSNSIILYDGSNVYQYNFL